MYKENILFIKVCMSTPTLSVKKKKKTKLPVRVDFNNLQQSANVFRNEQPVLRGDLGGLGSGLRGRLRGYFRDIREGTFAETAVRPNPPRHLELCAATRQAGGDTLVQGWPADRVGDADPLPGLRPPTDRRQASQDTSGQIC